MRETSSFKLRSTFLLFYFFPVCLFYFLATDDVPPSRHVIKHRLDLCDVMSSRRLAGRQKFGEKFWERVRPKRRRFPANFLSSESAGRTRLGRWVGTSRLPSAALKEGPGNKARGRLAVHATAPTEAQRWDRREAAPATWRQPGGRGLFREAWKTKQTKSWAKSLNRGCVQSNASELAAGAKLS